MFPLERWGVGSPGKGHNRPGWDNGHFLYLVAGLGYTGVCICQNTSNGALRIYAFHAMQILPQEKKNSLKQMLNSFKQVITLVYDTHTEIFRGQDTQELILL